MTLDALAHCCEATLAVRPAAELPILRAYTSDLLSDVIAHAPEESVLITVQNHLNTLAVSTLAGIRAVLVCHGRPLPDDMRAAAAAENVALLSTPLDQFTASLRVGAALAG